MGRVVWGDARHVGGGERRLRGYPPGELEIHRYAHVEARDGRAGRVDAFAVESTTGQITHLIMREGHLWGQWGQKEVIIPITAIARIADEAVQLSIDRAALAALPTAPRHHH